MEAGPEWFVKIRTLFEIQWPYLLIGLAFSFGVALVRLYSIRDLDGGKLPPSFPAKAFFLLTNVVIYCLIVVALLLSPALVRDASEAASSPQLDLFLKQIPFVAVVVVGFLFSLPQSRELERHYAIFLHSAQHRSVDEMRLREHLVLCRFEPSASEHQLNEVYLQQFNLYFTERDNSLVRLGTVEAWRKVSAILRRVRDNENWDLQILSADDRYEIEQLERAHRRKTALAVSIIKVLNDLSNDESNSTKLARITELLTNTLHHDRDRVTDAEHLARTIIEGSSDGIETSKPLRISEQQLMRYFSQIESYFIVEYNLILQRISRIAAKSVVRAGDLSENRLDDLKAAGFSGLGTVDQVTFDRVIWVILVSWTVTFGLLALPRVLIPGFSPPPGFATILFSIASTFSLAALIGSVWGSRRGLAERRITPWSSYLLAGLFAILAFYVVHSLRFVFDSAIALTPMLKINPNAQYFEYLVNIFPFALTPFIMTVAICRLARLHTWPIWPLLNLPDRVKDGLVLGVLFVLSQNGTRFLHKIFDTAFSQPPPNTTIGIVIAFQVAFALAGFVIGLLVIGDVRNIAHSHIVLRARWARPGAASSDARSTGVSLPARAG